MSFRETMQFSSSQNYQMELDTSEMRIHVCGCRYVYMCKYIHLHTGYIFFLNFSHDISL